METLVLDIFTRGRKKKVKKICKKKRGMDEIRRIFLLHKKKRGGERRKNPFFIHCSIFLCFFFKKKLSQNKGKIFCFF